jgi:hypothetical protein
MSRRLVALWESFWFRPIAPHLYAVLRIVFGILGLAGLFGVADLGMFWAYDGLMAPPHTRAHDIVNAVAGANAAPMVVLLACVAAYVLMTLGIATPVTVPLAFAAALAQMHWNRLPLSAAFQTHLNLLFCLALAECGRVWSVDAWWRRERGAADSRPTVIWPLRLFRFQVAMIYGATGLWKFQDVHWRDGSALHYVLSNTQFRRFPYDPPPWSSELLTIATYTTLAWEILFPVLILWRPTRWLALVLGIVMHTTMMVALELGPFSLVMMASYLAFLDPDRVSSLVRRVTAPWQA